MAYSLFAGEALPCQHQGPGLGDSLILWGLPQGQVLPGSEGKGLFVGCMWPPPPFIPSTLAHWSEAGFPTRAWGAGHEGLCLWELRVRLNLHDPG